MKTTAFRLTLTTLVLLALAASAHANFYTVTLKNGTTFDVRYQPVKADWDPSYSMLRTDQGNWIALRNDEIADVVSRAEESGFGFQVDTTTLFVGFSPNDLVNDEAGEEGGEPTQRYEVGGDTGAGNYSIDQFVNLPVAGAPTSTGGGIPYGTVTVTGGGNN